jgi:hypothetical protein
MKMKADFEIGGVHVAMTEKQAARWNEGNLTDSDLDNVRVFVPQPVNDYREITLRRATNEKLEPEISEMMHGCEARQTGEWKE